jgi:tripartite-type tricarboxylate transporter receptor subunit TctC
MRAKHPAIDVARLPACAVAALACIAVLALPAAAETYPGRPVRIIVPFPAGGTADAVPRLVADRLARKWNQGVVIENKAGSGGNIGAEAAYRATPDGYTLFSAPPPPLVINQNLYPKLGFDPAGFVPISVMASVPNTIVVNPKKIAATTVAEFIAYARANPGRITVATQGNGTTSHLTSELFQMMAQVKFVQVPYRGSAPALLGLAAGDVDVMFDNLASSLPLVSNGELRLIAVAADKRISLLPDVPTIAETVPGFASSAWYAMVAPPRTPAAVAAKVSADIAEALEDAALRQRLAAMSAEPLGGTPGEAATFMRTEVERWNNVIKAANVKLE